MQLGSRLHRKIQSSMSGEYKAEVSLKHTAYYEDVEIVLEGRADGIITSKTPRFQSQINSKDLNYTIDEIKVIRQDMEKLEAAAPVHIAQAVCYAYMYAMQKKSDDPSDASNEKMLIGIQITYCHPETEEIKRFFTSYTFDEIKSQFNDYIFEYGKWAQFL